MKYFRVVSHKKRVLSRHWTLRNARLALVKNPEAVQVREVDLAPLLYTIGTIILFAGIGLMLSWRG